MIFSDAPIGGTKMSAPTNDLADGLLANLCEKHEIPPALVKELLQIEREYQAQARRHGIYGRIAQCIKDSTHSRPDQGRSR